MRPEVTVSMCFDIVTAAVSSKISKHSQLFLRASRIETPLGTMIALSDNTGLYLLEFADRRELIKEIERLKCKYKIAIIPGRTDIAAMIAVELGLYFAGKLTSFKTPVHLMGGDFHGKAWRALMQIPYAQTISYKKQAQLIGNEKAFRAVANANAANKLAIIIPCHRVINHSGDLGGYKGGKARKASLIKHEKYMTKSRHAKYFASSY